MTDEQARYQAFAASGATIVAFIGLVHDFVGESLWPWAPALVGGYPIWYAMGLACFLAGLALFAAALGFIRFNVTLACAALVVAAIGATVLVAVTHQVFHFFAVSLALAAVATAYFHRKAAA
ncbi:MAG TPA: hypothetical protein VF122_07040 [Caulobacteraceae bacterium]